MAPHRLQIYNNNVSKYMRQTYGRRSFPDDFFLTLWGFDLYAYKQRKQLFVNLLALKTCCPLFIIGKSILFESFRCH